VIWTQHFYLCSLLLRCAGTAAQAYLVSVFGPDKKIRQCRTVPIEDVPGFDTGTAGWAARRRPFALTLLTAWISILKPDFSDGKSKPWPTRICLAPASISKAGVTSKARSLRRSASWPTGASSSGPPSRSCSSLRLANVLLWLHESDTLHFYSSHKVTAECIVMALSRSRSKNLESYSHRLYEFCRILLRSSKS